MLSENLKHLDYNFKISKFKSKAKKKILSKIINIICGGTYRVLYRFV